MSIITCVQSAAFTFAITESVAAKDYDHLADVIEQLKREGFKFSIDDYGTGYSNMSSLFSLGADIIKIDKSILWNAEKSELGMTLLKTSIDMVHKMQKKALMEGVETEQQIEILKKLGVGEPWFDTIESVLSHALFGIPAVKGVEFGAGFAAADMRGSQCNDNFRTEDGTLTAATNNNGGILGGITTGMPILFRTAIKPTPSIYKEQQTIDMRTMDNTTLQIKGRHDPAIVHRARVVADSITALVLCDQLSQRFGTDWLAANS